MSEEQGFMEREIAILELEKARIKKAIAEIEEKRDLRIRHKVLEEEVARLQNVLNKMRKDPK